MASPITTIFSAAAGLLLLIAPPLQAETSSPHPHQGVLTPFGAQPPRLSLDEEDNKRLRSGTYVIKQSEGEKSGGGIIVQDIHAPVGRVWETILSFENYPQWVKHVNYCQPYERSDNHIKVAFELGVIGFSYRYFIDHIVDPQQHYLRWTLDYQRNSELDDVVGFWHAEAHPDKPGWTRLYYSVSIRLKGWMPGFLQSFISRSGLKDATAWVKEVAEQPLPATLQSDVVTGVPSH
ncbi:MAG TPA: SRPBCC family protein [Candidatus Tenderia sp.]|nr:SRPBCC family protein [Candidatus Tenderia sp.]